MNDRIVLFLLMTIASFEFFEASPILFQGESDALNLVDSELLFNNQMSSNVTDMDGFLGGSTTAKSARLSSSDASEKMSFSDQFVDSFVSYTNQFNITQKLRATQNNNITAPWPITSLEPSTTLPAQITSSPKSSAITSPEPNTILPPRTASPKSSAWNMKSTAWIFTTPFPQLKIISSTPSTSSYPTYTTNLNSSTLISITSPKLISPTTSTNVTTVAPQTTKVPSNITTAITTTSTFPPRTSTPISNTTTATPTTSTFPPRTSTPTPTTTTATPSTTKKPSKFGLKFIFNCYNCSINF